MGDVRTEGEPRPTGSASGNAAAGSAAAEVAEDRDPAKEIAGRLPVTDRRSWLILLGVGALLVAGVVWLVFGRAPESVVGNGMLVPAGGYVEVGVADVGVIDRVLAAPGDSVAEGQLLATLVDDRGVNRDIVSPVAGVVAAMDSRAGAKAVQGEAVAVLSPADARLEVVAFLPAGRGTLVQPGMTAYVGVDSLPQSQYGMLVGKVEAVAPLPVTDVRIRNILAGSEGLAEYFQSRGPVLEVRVSLVPDATTPTGYAWTLGDGPDAQLSTGVLATVEVVLSDAAPIENFVP